MRFKRVLEKTKYREEGQDICERGFKSSSREYSVASVKSRLIWDRDEDEEKHDKHERGYGCFYDGMGMMFDGKHELNEPGVTLGDNDARLRRIYGVLLKLRRPDMRRRELRPPS